MNEVVYILVYIGFWIRKVSILNSIWQTFLEVDHRFFSFFSLSLFLPLSLEIFFIHQNNLVVTDLKLCLFRLHRVEWEMDCEITQQHTA